MRKTKIQELSCESFSKYGSFANMINPKAVKFGAEPIEFFRDMVPLDLGCSTTASFSICRVCKRPAVVDVSEFHNSCGEGILPLDADALIHVAPANAGRIPPEQIEIFRVPKGTFVSLNRGVWHHAPFTHNTDVANVLVVLPERTYTIDCHVSQIDEDDRIQIAQ